MANRFWVGGTASWNGTPGSKWATTSGGTGGALEPTSADDVFFDASSGSVTVTISTTQPICASLNFTGFTGTLTGSTGPMKIFGTLTIVSGMTFSYTGGFEFNNTGSASLTSAGKDLGNIDLEGIGTVTLQDNLTTTGQLSGSFGTFNANNKDITCAGLSWFRDNSTVVTMGSGTWTITGAGIHDLYPQTLNANTSTLKFTNSSNSDLSFDPNSRTLYNVWFARGASTGAIIINRGTSGNPTFNTFKDTGTAAHAIRFNQGATFTFSTAGSTGFNVNGNAGNLITITSDNSGSAGTATHTLSSASGIINCDYLSIQHSIATGGATWNGGAHSTNNQAVSTAGSGWSFTIDYILAISPASFALTGQTVAFQKSMNLAISPASFTLTMQTISLIKSLNLSISPASYLLTLKDMVLSPYFRFRKEVLNSNSFSKEPLSVNSFNKEGLNANSFTKEPLN